jgi:Tfp pilus assembly protein PilF
MMARRPLGLIDRMIGWKRRLSIGFAFAAFLVGFKVAAAADVATAWQRFDTGDYAAALKEAQAGIAASPGNEEWHLLFAKALLTVGRNADAEAAIRTAMATFPQSIRTRWAAREVALANGSTDRAAQFLDDIRRFYLDRGWTYQKPPDLVVFGRAMLTLNVDPKAVLDRVFAEVQKMAPTLRDVYLARGELALEKHDFALAAKAFEDGLKQIPDDAELNYGLAAAHAEGDRPTMAAALDAALKKNPKHIPSLLLLTNHRIDEENYLEADKILAQIIEINPIQPDAWALKAVLAHLRNDPAGEQSARAKALSSWSRNPRVDWLIGQKLSQKYRFAEGAARQEQALVFDVNYLPAQSQLASDLLRLGREAEGWKLAEAVHKRDAYDVEAFNLATLHDTMSKYGSMTNDDFVLRMTSSELAIYGKQVMELLMRAKRQLVEKYGVQLAQPTYVEVFADPKDFAVRTFGMPDVGGFLGVCFGQVVTANSPASTAAHGTNWQSVLWHEFCHVVTLQLTANKMPRWLSEGISVYEERQAHPSWGQHMTPKYREMILKGTDPKKSTDLTPISKMSAAFMAPPSPMHLQFAYYQSSMVVEYIATKYGAEKLRAVLRDLREGKDINTALAQEIAPMEKLEEEFTAYARAQAEQLGPKLDWEKPDAKLLRPGAENDLAEWGEKHPNNYGVMLQNASKLMGEKKWVEAKTLLDRLIEAYPEQRGPESAYKLLAAVHSARGETEQERAALAKLAALDYESPETYLRLMELGAAAKDWPDVAVNADRFLQVNPLIAPPYRYLAEARKQLGDAPAAIQSNRTLLLLDPANPSEVHFELAQLLHGQKDPEARRQVLQALEDAPRNRAALNLLLTLNAMPAAPASSPVPENPSLKK